MQKNKSKIKKKLILKNLIYEIKQLLNDNLDNFINYYETKEFFKFLLSSDNYYRLMICKKYITKESLKIITQYDKYFSDNDGILYNRFTCYDLIKESNNTLDKLILPQSKIMNNHNSYYQYYCYKKIIFDINVDKKKWFKVWENLIKFFNNLN